MSTTSTLAEPQSQASLDMDDQAPSRCFFGWVHVNLDQDKLVYETDDCLWETLPVLKSAPLEKRRLYEESFRFQFGC